MIKITTKSFMAVCCVLMAFSSCQKESTSQGEVAYVYKPVNLNASLSTTATASGAAVAAGTNGSINWASGNLTISGIEISAKKDQQAVSYHSENLDLTGLNILSSTQVAGSAFLPSGTYGDVELKFTLTPAKGAFTTLKGTYIEATGTKIPVEFQFNETLDFKIKGQQFLINHDKYTASITLELNNLVKNMTATEFGQGTRTAGAILITSTVNRALYEKLRANIIALATVKIEHA